MRAIRQVPVTLEILPIDAIIRGCLSVCKLETPLRRFIALDPFTAASPCGASVVIAIIIPHAVI